MKEWLCDRQKDCESGEDEHDQLCGEYSVSGCVIDRRTVSQERMNMINCVVSIYSLSVCVKDRRTVSQERMNMISCVVSIV